MVLGDHGTDGIDGSWQPLGLGEIVIFGGSSRDLLDTFGILGEFFISK